MVLILVGICLLLSGCQKAAPPYDATKDEANQRAQQLTKYSRDELKNIIGELISVDYKGESYRIDILQSPTEKGISIMLDNEKFNDIKTSKDVTNELIKSIYGKIEMVGISDITIICISNKDMKTMGVLTKPIKYDINSFSENVNYTDY